ncbi:YqgQ family protein [Mesobacillus jeotgali]|uniref:YqgQ family protein n=1 Tax=Mesobacillus jeotgali TaxID=129985 RepID=UPI00177FBF7E|nr:YqgQ family protein [Mesobacillus jeotgali]UYZ20763.1 YqgQ family protein [Mesobacillus jeotgali]
MKTIYDIQQFLKKFGTIIYIGDRVADLELMAAELKDLYNSQLIETKDYQTAILLLRQEIRMETEKTQMRKGDKNG